jgi:hypothetical protein
MHPIEKYIRSEPVDNVLKRLEPYKPKKLILGNHFIKPSMHDLIDGGLNYLGIPVERSDNKYEIDFEL